MSCALVRNLVRHRSRGLTLIEMLVAMAIILAFLGGAVLAFTQMIRANDRAKARVEAIQNGRYAIETMSLEFKRAKFGVPTTTTAFFGHTISSLTGDRIDNDQDGRLDEELFDGLDTDSDYNNAPYPAGDDKHVNILANTTSPVALYERPYAVGRADLDDGHVDEDLLASGAEVNFQTFPLAGGPSNRSVRFYLGSYDGEDHVLLEDIVTSDSSAPDVVTTSTGPLAHNVASFGLLFWDQTSTATNAWRTTWDSNAQASFDATQPEMPASIYMLVAVYSGTPIALKDVRTNQPLDTVPLHSIVNIEAVLADPRYSALRNARQ